MAIVDYFLKLEVIDGESEEKTHSKEIHIEAWSLGEQQSGTMAQGGGGGAGKVHMHDFHFVMKTNSASPKLFLACATGEHIKKAVLTCRKAGTQQQEFFKMTLTDVLVSRFKMGGGGGHEVAGSTHVMSSKYTARPDHVSGGALPIDQVSFNFTKIEISYAPQKPDGTLDAAIPAGFDLKKGEKV